MKFITDENLGIRVPTYLQNIGFDIVSVTEIAQGKPDADVLTLANEEGRIIITLDKDFGELVFKEKLIHTGVLLLRLKDESIENKKRILLRELRSGKDFMDRFTVVREKKA